MRGASFYSKFFIGFWAILKGQLVLFFNLFFFAQKKQVRLWTVLDRFLTVRAHFFTRTSLIGFLWDLLFFSSLFEPKMFISEIIELRFQIFGPKSIKNQYVSIFHWNLVVNRDRQPSKTSPTCLEKHWKTLWALLELLPTHLGPYTSDYITGYQFCAEREEQRELAL